MEAIMADKSYSNCPLKKRPVPVVEHDLPESDGDDEAQPVDLSARKSYDRFQVEDRLSDYRSTQPAERLEDFEARFAQPAEFSRFPYSPDSGYMVRLDSRESPASARESSISPPILRVNRTNVDYPHHYQQLFLNHNNNVIKEEHYQVHHRPLISPALSHMSYSSGYSDQATSTFEPEDLSTKAERRRVLLTDSRDNISRTHREQSVRVSDRENRYYQCAICKKCYSTPAGLVKHEQSHSLPQDLTTGKFAETPVLSRVDRAAVDSKTTLSVKHHGAPRYQCPDCGKSYSTYSGLTKHQQFHCPAAEGNQAKKFFSCKNCDKVYVSLGALKMHIRTHTLPCKCPLCGKAFSRPWLLQGHIRTHTGEKPFSCQHCHRAFADRSNLRAHLQTHSDVKKYSCSTCSKTFSRMSLLGKHLQSGCLGNQTGHQDEMTQINCNYTTVDQSVYYKANGSHPGYPSLRHPDYEMHQEYQSAEQPRYKEDVHVY